MLTSDPVIPTEEGIFVSQKWMHLSEMLKDYNPQLELKWIPPNLRDPEDRLRCYVITHRDINGKEYVVLYASELDLPEDIMGRVFANDMKHGDVQARMDARNTAAKLFEMKAKEEELAEKEELAAWLVQTKRTNPTFRDKDGELVKLDSQLNRVEHKRHM